MLCVPLCFVFGASHILFEGTNVFTWCANCAQDPFLVKGIQTFLRPFLRKRSHRTRGVEKYVTHKRSYLCPLYPFVHYAVESILQPFDAQNRHSTGLLAPCPGQTCSVRIDIGAPKRCARQKTKQGHRQQLPASDIEVPEHQRLRDPTR